MDKVIKIVQTQTGIATVGVGEANVKDDKGVEQVRDIITIYNTDEADNERHGVIMMDKEQAHELHLALLDAMIAINNK